MKHIRLVSRTMPRGADVWQDIVCSLAHTVNLLAQSKGGTSPIAAAIDDKCDIPVPNE